MHKEDSTPGSILRVARMAKGWSVDSVAKQLKLPPNYIEEIESDAYSQIDSAVYARGYLSAYSRLLGVSSQSVLDQFNAAAFDQKAHTSSIRTVPSTRFCYKKKYCFWGMVVVIFCVLMLMIPPVPPKPDLGRHNHFEVINRAD